MSETSDNQDTIIIRRPQSKTAVTISANAVTADERAFLRDIAMLQQSGLPIGMLDRWRFRRLVDRLVLGQQ